MHACMRYTPSIFLKIDLSLGPLKVGKNSHTTNSRKAHEQRQFEASFQWVIALRPDYISAARQSNILSIQKNTHELQTFIKILESGCEEAYTSNYSLRRTAQYRGLCCTTTTLFFYQYNSQSNYISPASGPKGHHEIVVPDKNQEAYRRIQPS